MKSSLLCVMLTCLPLHASSVTLVVQSRTTEQPTITVSTEKLRKLLHNDLDLRIAQQAALVDSSKKQEIAARIECRRSFTCESLRDTYEAYYTKACLETDRAQNKLNRLLAFRSTLNNPRTKIILRESQVVTASELSVCK